MSGASIEATLELWASSLRDVKDRMRPLFTQERVAASAGAFLGGLLGNEQRKTGWMRAETAGDPGPWRQQAILGRGRWEADNLRDIVRGYALETLAEMTRFWSSMKPDFSNRARPRAASRGNTQARRARKRLSAGEGVKGPRPYDWAYVELADIDASEYDASRSGLWTRAAF